MYSKKENNYTAYTYLQNVKLCTKISDYLITYIVYLLSINKVNQQKNMQLYESPCSTNKY